MSRVEPVLQEVRQVLHEACASNPDLSFLLAPPMYRSSVIWYREGLPEILICFSQMMMSSSKPPNLFLLPSFPTPEFDAGGVHLTAFSGLEFLLHLFDSAEQALEIPTLQPEDVLNRQCETTRALEDRVMVLEQGHRRLNRVIEDKIAVDAELADYRENERSEDCFMLEGVPLIPPEIVGKPWQDLARKHVRDFLELLTGRDMNEEIVVVYNATQRYKDAPITYAVKMSTVAASKLIRTKFGSFFVGGDKRPAEFKPYSVRNRVTPATKVRITILQLLAKRYKASNPGCQVKVIGFDPRPIIKINPAASASDRRIKVYNFIEAVRTLPTNFSDSEVDSVLKKINPRFAGKLRSHFIVLSDDTFQKRLAKLHPKGSTASTSASGSAAAVDDVAIDGSASSVSSGSGSAGGRSFLKRGASSPAENLVPPKK